jgi:DNA-binding beta-propeller fold protein YncE
MRIRAKTALLACLLVAGLAVGTNDASAFRERLSHPELGKREEWLRFGAAEAAELEGACGVAASPTDPQIYVSDYYRRAVGIYSTAQGFLEGGIALAGGRPREGINTLDAVCGLAVDSGDHLYGNEFHQAVLQLLPDEQVIDSGHSTGVAVDESGDVYVDDRTYVAVYDAPIAPDEGPVEKIGIGSTEDWYGLAVDSKSETVYVADASDNTIKGYVPKVSLTVPQVTIEFGFRSLVDAALAVDPTNGHLLVVDDSKPGFENPLAVIYEFDAAGDFLDRLSDRVLGDSVERLMGPIFGEPSGIAVDPKTGDLYVTTGNSVGANVVKYGPFEPFAPPAMSAPGGSALPQSAATTTTRAGASGTDRRQNPSASASEIVQRHGVRVRFDGKLTPRALPRHGVAPVGIAVDAAIAATGDTAPPQLRQIAIAINRNGHFDSRGLPVCRVHDIQPSTTDNALAACHGSLVGEGNFSADVKLPEQSPFPSAGKILAFNGRLHGRPAILAHIYGTQPAPTSTVLPFLIRDSHGTYGTVLEASLPRATGDWGYVTGLKMNLRRHFDYRGKGRSYLSAGCPAPAGFPSAAFPLARTSFDFAGGLTLVSVLNRSCRAKG